jgi:hypothetical protein
LPYIKPIETDEVALPSDPAYKVRLKKRATYGDQLAAQSAMLKLDPANPGVNQMEWSAYIQALSVSLIVEWNLTDENDNPLPITGASLARLSSEDGQFLAAEATKRAATRGVEQERPFEKPSSTPSPATT